MNAEYRYGPFQHIKDIRLMIIALNDEAGLAFRIEARLLGDV